MYVIRAKKSGVGMETRIMQGLGRTKVRASELHLLVDSVNGGQSKGTHMHTLTDSEWILTTVYVEEENRIQSGSRGNCLQVSRWTYHISKQYLRVTSKLCFPMYWLSRNYDSGVFLFLSAEINHFPQNKCRKQFCLQVQCFQGQQRFRLRKLATQLIIFTSSCNRI